MNLGFPWRRDTMQRSQTGEKEINPWQFAKYFDTKSNSCRKVYTSICSTWYLRRHNQGPRTINAPLRHVNIQSFHVDSPLLEILLRQSGDFAETLTIRVGVISKQIIPPRSLEVRSRFNLQRQQRTSGSTTGGSRNLYPQQSRAKIPFSARSAMSLTTSRANALSDLCRFFSIVEKSSFRLGSRRSVRGAGGGSGRPLVGAEVLPFSYGGGRVSSLTPWVLMMEEGMEDTWPDRGDERR
jgi:hypothetical protein